MEFFQRAKVVRLRSHHDKYLLADDDQEGVHQDRLGSCRNAKWTVEIVEHANLIRLKSIYGKYLTASNMPFLLGAKGKKVIQTLPSRLNSSLEWEPIREGDHIRLRTRYGQYLRANGGLPPWRNSITHDIPHRSKTINWVLWEVDLVEIRPPPPKQIEDSTPSVVEDVIRPIDPSTERSRSPSPSPPHSPNEESDNDNPFALIDFRSSVSIEGSDLEDNGSPMKEGRIIFYNVGDENGDVPEGSEEKFFTFKGSSVIELKEKLREEVERDDILVCSRNPLNAKVYPLRLQLPPNNVDLHVIVVPSSFVSN
ncbi:uncharacterized protein LOC131624301 [Vicia villosa]|uniref:uncharacterized protein LOC131624271 n=1 Tax=Vicia villosa TaxID=3911 RepID=UPI00273BE0F4|nr:uncharacterized protein LOC131624271 [Vicia villosa]XP_058751231.1 uncharacterized protein LOC131624301 [Vicia villosa]